MINLLPEKEKREFFFKQAKKLLVILGNIIFISFICLMAVLFSMKVYISGEVKAERIILEKREEESKIEEILNFKTTVKEYNENFLKLKKFYQEQVYLTDILEKLSETAPQEIYFTNLSFKKEDNKIRVTASGFSGKREYLTLFKENLEKNFKNIDFSPASWIKPVDVNFYLTFEQ